MGSSFKIIVFIFFVFDIFFCTGLISVAFHFSYSGNRGYPFGAFKWVRCVCAVHPIRNLVA
jgi:hypothetical protein